MIVLVLLASCAQQEPKPSPFTGFYKNYSGCRAEYEQMDARVEAAGVRDAEFYRVPGHPYLRTDRLLATFGPQVRSVDDVSEWVRRMREYDQEARDYEYANLGMDEIELSLQRDRFLNCGKILANIELTEPGALDALVEIVYPKDAYSGVARVLALHALRVGRISAREAAQRERIAQSQLDVASGTEASQEWTVKPVEDLVLMYDAASKMQYNNLGFPNLFGSQWRALAETLAPRLRIDAADDRDAPSTPTWTAAGLDTDPAQPIMNYQIGYTRFGGELLVQITYTAWFPALARSRATPIDGLVWRVTLDRQLEPLVYESLHPSGGDHRWYPVRTLALKNDAQARESFVSEQLVPARNLVLRLEAGTHRLRQVSASDAAATRSQREFALQPYEQLYTLPLPGGGTRSLFGPDGLMVGGDGEDEVAGWSSGIRRPGVVRQAGHHAITYVARRHFDDPDLMDATFVAPAPIKEPARTASIGSPD